MQLTPEIRSLIADLEAEAEELGLLDDDNIEEVEQSLETIQTRLNDIRQRINILKETDTNHV